MQRSLQRIFCVTTIVRLSLTASVPLPTFATEIQPFVSQNLFLIATVEPRPVDWFKNIQRDSSAYQPRLTLQLDA